MPLVCVRVCVCKVCMCVCGCVGMHELVRCFYLLFFSFRCYCNCVSTSMSVSFRNSNHIVSILIFEFNRVSGECILFDALGCGLRCLGHLLETHTIINIAFFLCLLFTLVCISLCLALPINGLKKK